MMSCSRVVLNILSMLFQSGVFLIYPRSRQTTRLFFTVFLVLLATITKSFGSEDIPVSKPLFVNSTSSRVDIILSPPAGSIADDPRRLSVNSENRTPDWNGILLDTGAFLGTQFIAAGIVYLMPESVSGWSPNQKKDTIKHYSKNFINPVLDKDPFYINYVLHPYWGATYYTRGRERGLDKVSSFYYSALMSAMFEFGPECFFEKPSIQDLIVTPVAGSLLGAFIFEPWRESIKRKQELRWYDHTALVLTDPLGFLSLGFEKMFGLKSTVMVDYSVPQLQKSTTGSTISSKNSRLGLVVQFSLN